PELLEGATLGEALLATHRPYLREVRPLRDLVRGISHITGGGYPENLPRILPNGLAIEVDTRSWHVPGIFRLIRQRGEIGAREMYEVFNMGIGLALIVRPEDADQAVAAVAGAALIGTVTESTGPRVVLRGLED
ncbi:MAG: AIR synthase-related protein, partial [Dehalococcoidia bacterium]